MALGNRSPPRRVVDCGWQSAARKVGSALQYLFALFGLALLLGIARSLQSWLRRRRYPDRYEERPLDPRQDYARTNVAKYNQSLGHMPDLHDRDEGRDY